MIGEKDKAQLYSLNMKLADIYCEPSAKKDYHTAISYAKKALAYATANQQKAYALAPNRRLL